MTVDAALVVTVAGRPYALTLEDVVEVVRMVAVRPLPDAPPWLAGVVDRRGEVVPVVDLAARLGGPARPPSVEQVLLFARARGEVVGLVADSADGVVAAGEGAVADGAALPPSGAAGVVRVGDRLVPILEPSWAWPGAGAAAVEEDSGARPA